MAPIIVLITGANRGLGQGLVKGFAAELDHINASGLILHLQFDVVTDTKSTIDCYSCHP
jgi:NAD(P)-dependent dehydrogenase (short-subunit alcohol dehydrogenase family)